MIFHASHAFPRRPRSRRRRLLLAALVAVLCGRAWPTAAQGVAGEPGERPLRVSFGGEVTGTIAPPDDGYFNFTDYNNTLVRLFTASLDGALRLGERVEVLGEFRVQNDDASASGLYLRVRPWRDRPLAIQAGRIPPVFGRFARRGYGQANPLIGVPLAYQYLTTLRATEVPYGADALLAVRGRGWLVRYPAYVGQPPDDDSYGPGLPLVSSMRWDTGVQAQFAGDRFSAAVALTNGSLCNPRVDDDNRGKQVAGRLTWQPTPAVGLGLSLARGAFLADEVVDDLPPDSSGPEFVQKGLGLDAEVSWGYWVVRGEAIVSTWTLPQIGHPAVPDPLRSTSLMLEARYRVRPGWHVAARGERLMFSRIAGSGPGGAQPWDAPVSRVEVGVGYSVTRHIGSKLAWQYNWRDGVDRPLPREGLVALQVSAWF
jgi:hypothetical protein